MTEAIKIKNLGPIKDIAIDKIRPLTAIIGESGSGKSLFMKVLSLMRFIYKKLNVRCFLLNSGFRRSPFRIRLDTMLHDDLKYYLTRPGVEVEYSVTADSGNTYFIRISGNKVSMSKSIANEDLVFTKESWVSETRNVIATWKANPANNRGWLGFFFHETLNDFNEAAATIDQIDMNFVGARMKVMSSANGKRFLLAVDGKHDPIDIRFASSGMQTAAPLAALAQYFARSFSFKEAKRRSVLSYLYEADRLVDFHPQIELADMPSVINMHVEEPELSLDPVSQIRLVESLVGTSFDKTANHMTLTFATHSPYIVNALNLIINRHDDNLRLSHDSVAAYRFVDGHMINLMAKTEAGINIVDTTDLTAPMEQIYEEYVSLTETDSLHE